MWLSNAYQESPCSDVLDKLLAELSRCGIDVEVDEENRKRLSSIVYNLKSALGAKRGGRARDTLKRLWRKSYAAWPVVIKRDLSADNAALRADVYRLERERAAERQRLEEERAAERQRLEAEHAAERQRLEAEHAAERQRLEEERAAERQRLEGERAAELGERLEKIETLQATINEKDHQLSTLAASKHSLQKRLEASCRRKRQHDGKYSASHLRRIKKKLTSEASDYGLNLSESSTTASLSMSPLAANRIMDECNVSLRTMRKVCQASPVAPSGYAISKLRKE